MTPLILKMSISLDGYVASTDRSPDWVAAGSSEDAAAWVVDTVRDAGAHLMGSATYAEMAAHWPGDTSPFAAPMNEIPKYVFSSSLASADWTESTIVRGDLASAVARLKHQQHDGYLLAHGGVRFARSLVGSGLVDEYRLVVHPVALGDGDRLFLSPQSFEHVRSDAFAGGAVGHVLRAAPGGSRHAARPKHV
jgi:dihydrofolate reductase